MQANLKLAENIWCLRRIKGYTLQYVADYCGVSSKSTVRAWEKGICYPQIPKLVKLSALLGKTIDELLFETLVKPMSESGA